MPLDSKCFSSHRRSGASHPAAHIIGEMAAGAVTAPQYSEMLPKVLL